MPATVFHAHLWGTRPHKYATLRDTSVADTQWAELQPQKPFHLFVPQDAGLRDEYDLGVSLITAMPHSLLGFQTHRDGVAVAFDQDTLKQQVIEYLGRPPDHDKWTRLCCAVDYRPFDSRFAFLCRDVADRPRHEVALHLIKENIGLNVLRQTRADAWQHALISRRPTPAVFIEIKDGSSCVPLYLYPKISAASGKQTSLQFSGPYPAGKHGRVPNLSPVFVADLEERLSLSFVSDGVGDLAATFGPEDVFHYIYAVFHSPGYRERYAEFLKIDFPRVPLTSDVGLFRALCGLGADLVALHLLEDDYPHASWVHVAQPPSAVGSSSSHVAQPPPAVDSSDGDAHEEAQRRATVPHEESQPGAAVPHGQNPLAKLITSYPVNGDNTVEKRSPKYVAPGETAPGDKAPVSQGRVYISKTSPKDGRQAQYFDGVPPEVWAFHVGGYQVCEKWLKDRRGRQLSYEDLTHYQRVVVALHETIRLMAEVDAAIAARGGWPIQ